MTPIPHLIRTNQYPMLGTKPPPLPNHPPILRHPRRTPPTHDILLVQRPVQRGDLVPQKGDDGRVLEEVGAVGLAARAVARLVHLVPVLAVVLDPFARDLAGQDLEVVEPPFEGGVVACAGGVVFEEAGEGPLCLWWLIGGGGGLWVCGGGREGG